MEPKNPMMQGILLFPPQGVLGQLKKTWHKKYCQLFKPSKVGIKRLEVYDSQEEALGQPNCLRIIPLEACVKIMPSAQPHVFTVVTKTHIHHFGCISDADMTSWISSFQTVAFEDTLLPQTIEEDNDLYCTSGEGVFAVKVVESDASKRCGLQERNYTLIIAAMNMKLMDGDDVLFTWPYRSIRRYGYRDGKFTFEAGRKCDSGEGSFSLEHNNQQEIFKCISTKMNAMKRLLSGDSSSSIEFNNAQYHAALSMEAGSRSPLPPSPNSSGNLPDLDFSTISQNSQKHSTSTSSSLDSIPFIKPPPPIIKPKPAKPPRKNPLASLRVGKSHEQEFPDANPCGRYAPLSGKISSESQLKNIDDSLIDDQDKRYDSIEVRNDAWRRYGIGNPPHTEEIGSLPYGSEEVQYETMEDVSFATQGSSKSKSSANDMVITPTSPIIHNNVFNRSDPPNYDTLQHFGSTHKLNHNSAYRTPNVMNNSQINSQVNLPPVPLPAINGSPSSQWDDYESVEDMQAVRLADDSSHGYGVINKKSRLPHVPVPNHKIYNETEYAIISKPKRV